MIGDVQFSGSVRTRVESWNWFNPGSGAQNQHTFPGSILQLGISQSKTNFDWQLRTRGAGAAGIAAEFNCSRRSRSTWNGSFILRGERSLQHRRHGVYQAGI